MRPPECSVQIIQLEHRNALRVSVCFLEETGIHETQYDVPAPTSRARADAVQEFVEQMCETAQELIRDGTARGKLRWQAFEKPFMEELRKVSIVRAPGGVRT